MGGGNVKNTIIEKALQIVAPHICYGCGENGVLICVRCKYDIVEEPFSGCIVCQAPHLYGICAAHNTPIVRAFVVGGRHGTLKKVIDGLKFSRTKAAAAALADLLHTSLPLLPMDTLIVPVPTARSHIRQRGYDQVLLIARQFADLRGMHVEKVLVRETSYTQHEADRAQRGEQIQGAFSIADSSVRGLHGRTVLLIDDVITTGATVLEVSRVLQGAGATVWVGALAYQPLD